MPLRLVVAHLVSTVFMVGVIWMVQLVHYPLLARVGVEEFTGYQAAHSTRITALIALPWAVQGLTAVALVASHAPPACRCGWSSPTSRWSGSRCW